MRVLMLIPAMLLVAAAAAACDGDDDDGGTPSAAVPTSASTAATSPTAAATPDGEAAISIDEPAADATVTVPFAVNGDANVFEGALMVDVLGNAAGLVLCSRPVQATSGTGTPGTWETTVAFEPPASDSPVTLRAYSLSAEDGSPVDVVERSITVSAEQPDIVIVEPACNAEVPSGSTLAVSGNALVFEAALTVELRDYFSGTMVRSQNVMAADGTQRSPWSASFALDATVPPGLYELVALNFSARDGTVENEFAIPIRVTE